jgi:hypothetical protein
MGRRLTLIHADFLYPSAKICVQKILYLLTGYNRCQYSLMIAWGQRMGKASSEQENGQNNQEQAHQGISHGNFPGIVHGRGGLPFGADTLAG